MRKTLLLADDSATIRKIVELTFAGTDISVEAVASGAEALAWLAGGRADAVLADVAMPEPGGYELCRLIKESAHPVPVLLLAGAFEPLDPESARRCGADGHLVKPFESSLLVRRIQTLIEAPPAVARPAPVSPAAPFAPGAGGPSAAPPAANAEVTSADGPARLSPHDLRELAREVAALIAPDLARDALREVAREILPQVAERVVRERILELEREER